MVDHMAIAMGFIYVSIVLIAVLLAVILTVKARGISREKQEAKIRSKYADYFSYIQAHLGGEERLKLPPQTPSARELTVIQRQLMDWMERVRGNDSKKLAQLCEELGLADLEQRRLHSRCSTVQMDAAYKLGVMRAQQAVPDLLELLRKQRRQPDLFIVARAIARCARDEDDLRQMTVHLVQQSKHTHQLIVEILRESPIDCSPLLIEFLGESDAELVKVGLTGLSVGIDSRLDGQLSSLLTTGEKELRIKAVKLFTRTSNWLTVANVKALLRHADWEVRAAAAKAIGFWGTTEYIGLLKDSLRDPNWWVSYNSASSLAMLGEDGFYALCEAAADTSNLEASHMAQSAIEESLIRPMHDLNNVEKLISHNRKLHIYEMFFGKDMQSNQAI
ncbi:HEAT repeat domain-containing protein [Brevibacillus massiliensis]|jgi:hypothetical protein|uniref:HEAT repeat domain-containing protein n=1 Tax=Brevibacillus massiliensis TaxID=1118054 RepID=UPI0002E4F791|nr:HEAT repeat domain-containing protein [Brevibacillus massiliensis]